MSTSKTGSSSPSSKVEYARVSKSTFLPASFGNSVACYRGAVPGSEDAGAGNEKSKNKGKSAAPTASSEVKFAEFDVLNRGRREFTAETYTVYTNLQNIANGFESGELFDEDGFDDHAGMAMTARRDGIPQAAQIAYYSRFAQLYQDSLSRYLVQVSSEDEIDTAELSLISSLRDIFHLAQVVYIPQDGRGDGIVAEEMVDYLNTTSPWPTAERREALTSLAAPYENGDFWYFIYSSVLRGHFSHACSILKTLLKHPSTVLQRVTQSCLDLLSSLPRSNSSQYSYESSFLSAHRTWRSKLTSQISRLDIEMDEVQEEIESLERGDSDGDGDDDHDNDGKDEAMDACEEERNNWQAGFNGLLNLLNGDVQSVLDASEDGWKSALTAWCLLVRPGLKRDDLPDTIQAITSKLPPDQTIFKECISIALISDDVPRVLRLTTETDTWLASHLCDLFSKLGLLSDIALNEDQLSFRDYFVLLYVDLLLSDPGMWRMAVDYLASLENLDVGRGRMAEILLSLGSTANVDVGGSSRAEKEKNTVSDAANGQDAEEVDEVIENLKRGKGIKVEDVLEVCAQHGLEDVTRSICLTTAENLISQRKYGQAVAYCIRANDSRRINKISDLILDEYITSGVSALSYIDEIPTSLLNPAGTADGSIDSPMWQDSLQQQQQQQHALTLATSTRLSFLARYRDFHALYASGERRDAAELLVLLMSSNAAPKRFWCIMLIDAVALLNDREILVNEQDTFELMRCLSEIVLPIQKSGRDLYGYLECLSRIAGAQLQQQKKSSKKGSSSSDKQQEEREKVEAGLRQLEVVRHALAQNLGRCFMHQM